MHLADAFIQSIQAIHLFLSVCVFPGNWTHKLLHCQGNALPLSYWATGTHWLYTGCTVCFWFTKKNWHIKVICLVVRLQWLCCLFHIQLKCIGLNWFHAVNSVTVLQSYSFSIFVYNRNNIQAPFPSPTISAWWTNIIISIQTNL